MSAENRKRFPQKYVAGFTLVELMIALLLGLLVMGAAISIFLSNRQAYAATEGLGRVQENVRFAFELMARDLRETGANPCGRHIPAMNVVANPGANWWTNLNTTVDASGELVTPWRSTLLAFGGGQAMDGVPFGGGAGGRVPGTEAVRILGASDPVYAIESHDPAGETFTLTSSDPNLEVGTLAVVCDARQGSILRATSVAGGVVGHGVGAGLNCTGSLGLSADCASAPVYTYQPTAMLAPLRATQWYVGNNGRGGTSLYQSTVNANGAGLTNQEVVEGVENVTFEFLEEGAGAYQPTGGLAAWSEVVAVRMSLELAADTQGGTTDGEPLRRTVSHVVSLRSRNP